MRAHNDAQHKSTSDPCGRERERERERETERDEETERDRERQREMRRARCQSAQSKRDNTLHQYGNFLIWQCCLAMNNFNSSYAIVCGLNVAAVQRLKQTWEKVPKKKVRSGRRRKEEAEEEGKQ